MSDSDFPPDLTSAEKQNRKAKELATLHLGIPAATAKLTEIQGCFSRTVEVVLRDGRNVIIQFRIEPLDTEPFTRAHSLLGEKVPIIEPIDGPNLVEARVWSFYMTRIPGKTWLEYENAWSDAQRIKCAKSLGSLLSRCFVPGESSDVVDNVIIPNLRKLRALERDDVKPFFPIIDRLIDDAPALKTLPLFQGHLDLNEMNVLVEENGEITGVVDWELSPPPQPFGIACYCIQFLAGEIISQVYRPRPSFEAMDRAFWDGLMANTPQSILAVLNANLQAVQTSVMIGILFKVMAIEGDQKVFISAVTLKALPELVRYQIPALGGSGKAYGMEVR